VGSAIDHRRELKARKERHRGPSRSTDTLPVASVDGRPWVGRRSAVGSTSAAFGAAVTFKDAGRQRTLTGPCRSPWFSSTIRFSVGQRERDRASSGQTAGSGDHH